MRRREKQALESPKLLNEVQQPQDRTEAKTDQFK